MDKYYSQIIATEIITETGHYAGRVSDVVVDPDTGKVLGFLVGSKRQKIVASADILFWNQRVIIHDMSDIFDLEEIIKIEKIVKNNIPIINNKVVTKSGMQLGKVYDFAIHPQLFVLTKVFVTKSFLGVFGYDRKMIAHKNILEIKKDMIIVKDPVELIPTEEKKANLKPKLRIDIVPSGCSSNH